MTTDDATPETDEEEYLTWSEGNQGMGNNYAEKVVDSDFARYLERQRNALQAKLAEQETEIETLTRGCSMTDLEICKITARMCGKDVFDATPAGEYVPHLYLKENGLLWNPLVNPEQAMECLEELLKRRVNIMLHSDDSICSAYNDWLEIDRQCPAKEFFARALAEIGKEER